jgi:hypothetical protein
MLKQILKDIRFYILLLSIAILGAVFLFLLNQYIMPAYTRHDDGVTVPDVTKLPLDKARVLLTREGLRDSVVDRRYNASYPPDYIIDQTPSPSLIVKPNRLIYLTVNAASTPKVIIPDVTNMSLRNAKLQLQNYGLKVGNISYVSNPFKNTVIKQSIKPGLSVEKETMVNLTVSDGLGVNKVAVPKLTGLQYPEAQSKLRNANLRIGQVIFKDSVLSYSPSDKDSLLEGSPVNLVVSQRPTSQEAPETGPVFKDSTDVNNQDSIPRQPNKQLNRK